MLKADHISQQYRLEDKLLKYFPAEIEKTKNYITGHEKEIQLVKEHPVMEESFVGMTIDGKYYSEKNDAGEMILAACKNCKASDRISIGSYRGFNMELSFESFQCEFMITLEGSASHNVECYNKSGAKPRGKMIK